MNKNKFHSHEKTFIDKTSSAVPDKNGKWPIITLNVKVNAEIPLSHRICR